MVSKSLASLRLRLIQAKALDHPSSRQDREANLTGALGNDLDEDTGSSGEAIAGIAAIGKDTLNEGEETARGLQQRPAAIAVLHACRMRLSRRARPSVSTRAWRLRPGTFLPASR